MTSFYSTVEAKTDFMRIIRQTIRESVRKMTVPSNGSVKNKYIPCGGKRLEALSNNPRSTLSKLRNTSNSKVSDIERHSMELDKEFRVLEDDGVFRTRSKTVGDLNDVSGEGDQEVIVSPSEMPTNGGTSSETSSCSNLSISSQSGSSAKLTFASANPLKYTSAKAQTPPMGSPVWKPRNEANLSKHQKHRSKTSSKVEDPEKTSNISFSDADSESCV